MDINTTGPFCDFCTKYIAFILNNLYNFYIYLYFVSIFYATYMRIKDILMCNQSDLLMSCSYKSSDDRYRSLSALD